MGGGRLSEHDRHEHIGEEHLLHRINAEFGHRTERHNPDGIHNDVERLLRENGVEPTDLGED